MRKLILLAGAAFVAAAGPVIAKPGGHANAQATAPHSMKAHSTIHSASGVKPAKVRALKVEKTTRLDRNHNGIADADEALARKYGGALCPPGLYKKTPSCMPPGQAKRLFRSGQRVPTGYKYYTPYSNIPQPLISQYDLTDQYRYIYRNNVIYVVDPATSLVTRIINAVL